LVGKLAPKRFASLLYGVFFIANAAGYALAGTLGAIIPATGDKFAKAQEIGVNLQDVLDKKITLNPEQAKALLQLADRIHNIRRFTIHNLFEFFMVFVVLCGIAAVLLAFLSPILKRMMHGVK
jgi:POT family proton-dependent oligopeptide transporter